MATEFPILTEDEVTNAKFEIYDKADEIADKFQSIFEKNGWKWSLGDDWRIPTREDISLTICVLAKNLYHGKQFALVSTGRIQIRLVKWRLSTRVETRVELIADTMII